MLDEFLASLTVDQLKPRLALLGTGERPTRKADMIALLRSHLLSPQLQNYWGKLEHLERLAVAEAIYEWDGRFFAMRFYQKYSDIPQIFKRERSDGSGQSLKGSRMLSLFFYAGTLPEELCTRLKAFVPEPEANFGDIWGTDDLSFFSRYDGLLYFRLNPLGAWCLDLRDAYQAVASPEAPLLTLSEDLPIELVRAG
jgi:hypothetical protein